MVVAASDEIKRNALAKRLALEEKQKELTTNDINFAATFLGDASQIDGVALSNRLPQMSTPKKAFLLSLGTDE